MPTRRYHTLLRRGLLLPLIAALLACNQSYTPKPSGYFRIDTGEHRYREFTGSNQYDFSYSEQAKIAAIKADRPDEEWFDIRYPAYQAAIHCSYMPIRPGGFTAASEDSRSFVYRHSTKADNIELDLFSNASERIYGQFYRIEGQVASPIQFTLSDSTSFFFRGALYFNQAVNRDSIAPVLQFIETDIRELMRSFKKK